MDKKRTNQGEPVATLGEAFRDSNNTAMFAESANSIHAVESSNSFELLKLVADVATGLWRLHVQLVCDGAGASEETQQIQRSVESILDTIAQADVEVRDHTGELVPSGGIYSLNVLAYEPTPSFASERVIETIKPSVYFKGRVIQMGQVIIGTPTTRAEQPDA